MELRVELSPVFALHNKDMAKLKEVLHAVCAILNSSNRSSKLILFSRDRAYTQKDADAITRKIEQKLQDTFGVGTTNDFFDKIPPKMMNETDYGKVHEMHYQIVPFIKLPTTLFTIKYHLYRTSHTQVQDTPSQEPLERVLTVIKGEQTRTIKHVLDKHLKTFHFGKIVRLVESKEIQLKCLDDTCTKSCNLATRMTSDGNKLVCYVSAFANGNGGHIYYGIKQDDSGAYVAYGQNVVDKEIIIKKVKSAINKLFVWPGVKTGCLKKGEQWDIFFEKVLDIKEPKYVIVISVNSHVRGVFTREPESYVVDSNGKVKPMELHEWVERFRLSNYRDIFSHEELPAVVGRCSWSSPEAFQNHLDMLEKLVTLRNDGRAGHEFTTYRDEVERSCDGNTKCLFQQQEAANLFRQKRLTEAEQKLKENEEFLNERPARCADEEIYQTIRLYWMGVVTRAQGDYEKCRELFTKALQQSYNQPLALVLPWIHYGITKVLEIDIAKEDDPNQERELRMECLEGYESAVRSSFALSKFPQNLLVNVKHRVYIGMARVSFGAFYDGTKVIHKKCLPNDIKSADHYLKVVDDSVKKLGLSMSGLNKAEYRLVRAEQYYHDWKESSPPCQELMDKAREQSEKALKSAIKGDFQDVIDFAEGQIKIFEVMSNMRIR